MKPRKQNKRPWHFQRRKCGNCGRMFGNAGARGRHWYRVHYVPPAPVKPIEPKREWKSFASLVRDTRNSYWGKNYTETEAKNPSNMDLALGYLAVLIEEVRKITDKLK